MMKVGWSKRVMAMALTAVTVTAMTGCGSSNENQSVGGQTADTAKETQTAAGESTAGAEGSGEGKTYSY